MGAREAGERTRGPAGASRKGPGTGPCEPAMQAEPVPTGPPGGAGSVDRAIAWRHPRVEGAAGRCIGARSDLAVDARRAKRLAHRIREVARRERLARVVAASPALRCRAVAGWLRRFGFDARIDARLREFDFGAWDGRAWDAIGRAELDAWSADFAGHAPGGGDTLADFLARVQAVRAAPPAPLLVTHGGWLSALRWLEAHGAGAAPPRAVDWPPAPGCGQSLGWRPQIGATSERAVVAPGTARAAPGAGVFGS